MDALPTTCAAIDFWGGLPSFIERVTLKHSKVRSVQWSGTIPPPFLASWFDFLSALSAEHTDSSDLDKVVGRILPLFSCDTHRLPIRTLTPAECLQVSGLSNHWKHTSIDDARLLSDRTIRDMCGHCFHPNIIASALGSGKSLSDSLWEVCWQLCLF